MKPSPACLLPIFLALLLLPACSDLAGREATPAQTITPQPTSTATIPPPTPAPTGQVVVYDGLEVTMERFELTQEYTNEYGLTQPPPQGSRYLWVHVTLKDTTEQVRSLPRTDRYSVLYHNTELKASYGHRQGYPDYTALEDKIYPGQPVDAWLRFEIPQAAEPGELVFAFNPESTQVSLNTPNRGEWFLHPVYLWNLTP